MMTPQQTRANTTANDATPFGHLPPDASGHFLLYFYADVHRLIAYPSRLDHPAGRPAGQGLADRAQVEPAAGGRGCDRTLRGLLLRAEHVAQDLLTLGQEIGCRGLELRHDAAIVLVDGLVE